MNKISNIIKKYNLIFIRQMHDRMLPTVNLKKKQQKYKYIGSKSPRFPNYNMGTIKNKNKNKSKNKNNNN